MTTHRVDFIDEDDARRVLLTLFEQIADAAGANADEHLDKVRTGNREKRSIRFAGDRTGQQSLTGSRRSNQQNALRNASAQFLKLLRLAAELPDAGELFLGFFYAPQIPGCDFLFLR